MPSTRAPTAPRPEARGRARARNARCSMARSASAPPSPSCCRRPPGRHRHGRLRRAPRAAAAPSSGPPDAGGRFSSTPGRHPAPTETTFPPAARRRRGTTSTNLGWRRAMLRNLGAVALGSALLVAPQHARGACHAGIQGGSPGQLVQGGAARRPRLRGQAHDRDPGPDPGGRDRGQADAQARLAARDGQGQVQRALRLLRHGADRRRQGDRPGAAASCPTISTTSSCSSAGSPTSRPARC